MTKPSQSGTTTVTNNSDPWSGQQPYLSQGFQNAYDLLAGGGVQQPYPGSFNATAGPYQVSGYDMLANYGSAPTALQTAAQNGETGIVGGSQLYTNPGNYTNAAAASGGLNVGTAGLFAPIATGEYQNTAGVAPLADIASGVNQNTQGMDTLNRFSSGAMLSADNPYFQSMANKIKEQVQPQTDAQFVNAGRQDSGLAQRAQTSALADSLGALAYQNYQQGLGQQQSAAAQLGQLGQGQIGQELQASQALSGIGQQNIADMLTASQGLTGIGQTNANLQLQGAEGLSGNVNTAQGQQQQAAALAPSLNGMNLTQIQALLSGGDLTQQQQQREIDAAMARWNQQSQAPWDALRNYMQAVQGQYGGTQTQSQPYYTNPGANILSTAGGLAGLGNALGLFGGAGAASATLGSLLGGSAGATAALGPMAFLI